jgi:acetyl-CoA synthetase
MVVTGQSVICFCTLKSLHVDEAAISASLKQQVRQHIGPFATPKAVVITPDLPKTRSGKIMRRVLRKVAGAEVKLEDLDNADTVRARLGDLSTLADPSIIRALVERVKLVRFFFLC